ncbi:claret [Anaeramoeba flamelloides]|uniref:Claret n=1 Tax=Anaeramoeba flamelloides TaxID=1746091 RepID=A0ABQ8XDB1_9EUKA|nr:claret [Anaeramoeba flamelloides]
MTEKKNFKPNGYSHGMNSNNNCLGYSKTVNSDIPSPIPFNFKKVACGYQTSAFLVSDKKDKGYYNTIVYNQGTKKEFKMEKEVKNISAGCYHILIQTVDHVVYGLGRSNRHQLGNQEARLDKPTKLNFFENQPFFVKKALSGGDSSYFLCSNNDLYMVGQTQFGPHSESPKSNIDSFKPVLISKDVHKVYLGVYGFHCFYTKTNDNKLYARGNCHKGQLGINAMKDKFLVEKSCPGIDSNEIVAMSLGHEYSCLLLDKLKGNGNTVYGCGSVHNGSGGESSVWKIVQELNNKNVVDIKSGCWNTVARTSNNDIWVWGSTSYGLTFNYNTKSNIPKKVVFNQLNQALIEDYADYSYKIECGLYQNFYYLTLSDKSGLINDIRSSFDQKKNNFKDLEILKNKLSVHKVFVEKRLKLKSEKILEIITNEINNEESVINFFQLVYQNRINNMNSISQIIESFSINITDFNKRLALKKDLYELYKDDDSKDFEIIVVEDIVDEDEDEDQDEEEEQFERIPVHKFILAARSGLFREMFQNVNNNMEMKEIKDYSGKTPESIEIFIRYLYTDRIELTADDDPQLIVEELSDAVEYYQLSTRSNLNSELRKIKRQYNIK